MQFYELVNCCNKSSYDDLVIDPVESKGYDDTKCYYCPKCQQVYGVGVSNNPEYEIQIAKPYYSDMTLSPPLYVSERFVRLFNESTLKGILNFTPIKVTQVTLYCGAKRAKLPPIPNYYLADVIVDGAVLDTVKSKMVYYLGREPKCDFCKTGMIMKYNSLTVDESRWNGNDIFIVMGIGNTILVDEAFQKWHEEKKLTGCKLVPVEERSEDWSFGMTPEEYAKPH